jgi:YHS domain-containing protein
MGAERQTLVTAPVDPGRRPVLCLEDGPFKELARLVTDPVCGMRLEPGRAMSLEVNGETLYFCAAGCRGEFVGARARNSDTLEGYTYKGALG